MVVAFSFDPEGRLIGARFVGVLNKGGDKGRLGVLEGWGFGVGWGLGLWHVLKRAPFASKTPFTLSFWARVP